MVPVLTKGGRSFKGAAAYYLHDKREEGEDERLTSDRVAWIVTGNLATDDPDRAWRMMADTAMSQAELKQTAGIKATGRKLTTPVFPYTLNWHETDRPTKAQMIQAIHESLQALGLADRQWLAIAHKDTAHPHVHVMVNRVSPENGIAAKLDGSKNRIQAWALDYQKRHGQTHCPKREENAQKRKQGLHANAHRIARSVFEFMRRVGNDSISARFTLSEQRQKDAQRYAQKRVQEKSHARQKEELTRTYKDGRAQLKGYETKRISQTDAAAKVDQRTLWDKLLRRQHEEVRRADAFCGAAQRTGDKIAADPSIALKALTAHHSTFTQRDLDRFIKQNSNGATHAATVTAKVQASADIVRLGTGKRGEERFTTREMQAAERKMMDAADRLTASKSHKVTADAQERALQSRPQLGDDQKAAFRHLTDAGGLASVIGYSGAGKSTMLDAAREAWEKQGYTVRGATLSGIASDSLEAGSGIQSRTIASLEFAWGQGKDRLTSRDVLVIDEAGMIDSRRMERLLSAADKAGAKVALIGDPSQLQAIEAGAAFRAIVDRHGKAELTTVRRQLEQWMRKATKDLATGRTAKALNAYARTGMVKSHATRADARTALIGQWANARRVMPGKSRMILAYTRDDVAKLNEQARATLQADGQLGRDEKVQTERGARQFAAGDRLMFLRNDRTMGVKNGTLATVERVGNGSMTVRLDGEKAARVSFNIKDYAHIDHGYAATVHKAQGVTVDRTYVLASPHMDRQAAYVALTRHRDGLALHYGQDDFRDDGQLARMLGRDRSKDTTLDYQASLIEQATREREAGGGLIGLLCSLFNPAERRQSLDTKHKQERAALTRHTGAEIKRRSGQIRHETKADNTRLRREYTGRAVKLASDQSADRAKAQSEWRGRNAERRATFNQQIQTVQRQQQTQGPRQTLRQSLRDQPPQQPGRPRQPN
jgi:Ti-type conjugative transfer relaxase TraA